MTDYVQGGMFGGLTFQPLGSDAPWGTQAAVPFSDIPAIPQISNGFAPSQTSSGNVVVSSGTAAGSAGVAATGAPYSVGPVNASVTPQPQASSGVASGTLADYFLRGVIIVLGFIFVAIGLNMFRPGTVPVPRIGAG